MRQLNPGQREEANVCFNITAKSQGRLGSGLTPGLTELPDHSRDRLEKNARKEVLNLQRQFKVDCVSLPKTFSDLLNTWSE